MKWKPAISDGKPSKYQIRSGPWAISKVWIGDGYKFELWDCSGKWPGRRIAHFSTSEEAKAAASLAGEKGGCDDRLELGRAIPASQETVGDSGGVLCSPPVGPGPDRFDELRRIIAGDGVERNADAERTDKAQVWAGRLGGA